MTQKPRNGLESETYGLDHFDDLHEAVQQLMTVIIWVASAADRERRRRQTASDYVELSGMWQTTKRLGRDRLAHHRRPREVALERCSVHRVGFDRSRHREASLLEPEGESACAREQVQQHGRIGHESTVAGGMDATGSAHGHDAGVSERVDAIVIGAGPSGLAAGAAMANQGCSIRILERGSLMSRRDRARAADLVCGVGGAGLYSDGKFSFAPSGTALWGLQPRQALREAYQWTSALLEAGGLDVPPFPELPSGGTRGLSVLKPYPSQYMSLRARMDLIAGLEEDLGHQLVTRAPAALDMVLDGVVARYGEEELHARAAIIASGRFAPLQSVSGLGTQFRRVEIGMRVEQDSASFALDAPEVAGLLDPKWVRQSADGRLEWRTFCCCRDGEVVETKFEDLTTVSGRADGAATGLSNFGMNVRFLDPDAGQDALMRSLAASRRPALRLPAADLLVSPTANAIADQLGSQIAQALWDGLRFLAEDFAVDVTNAMLHLPAIEGLGYYPRVDETLRAGSCIWVAGDATGAFRGLVPALVSGWLAGAAAASWLEDV